MARRVAVGVLTLTFLSGVAVYSWAATQAGVVPASRAFGVRAQIVSTVTECPCTSTTEYLVKQEAQDCWTCEPTPGDCHDSYCATAEAACISCCDSVAECEEACSVTRDNCEGCCVLP